MSKPIVPFEKKLWDKGKVKISQGYSGGHKGIDYAMPVGTNLLAAEDGKIKYASADWFGGHYFWLHGDSGKKYLYLHIKSDVWGTNYRPLAKKAKADYKRTGKAKSVRKALNKRVKRGQHIAESGSSGDSTGPHLHWEIANSKWIRLFPPDVMVWKKTNKPAPKPKPKDPCEKIQADRDYWYKQAQKLKNQLKDARARIKQIEEDQEKLKDCREALEGIQKEKVELEKKSLELKQELKASEKAYAIVSEELEEAEAMIKTRDKRISSLLKEKKTLPDDNSIRYHLKQIFNIIIQSLREE